jgi:hypothetical protein
MGARALFFFKVASTLRPTSFTYLPKKVVTEAFHLDDVCGGGLFDGGSRITYYTEHA